jgi:hypothetical protein
MQDEMNEEMVTVGRYMEPVRAQMAKGLLESVGIEGFLQGENANAMLALAFRARLLVRRADEVAAKEVLATDMGEELDDREEVPDGE